MNLPLWCSPYISNSDLIATYCAHPFWKFRFIPRLLFFKNAQEKNIYIRTGAVRGVLRGYMHPARIANGTFSNATTVKTVIKKLLHFGGQDFLHTTLYTYDSLQARRRWGLISRVLTKTGATVRACGMYSAAVRQWKLGGDGGNVEGHGGVPSLGGQTDHGYDDKTCGGRGVVISPDGGGNRSSRLTPHTGVHLDTAGDHHGTGSMPPHLWTMYWGKEDAGDEPDGDMVGSGGGAWIWRVDGESM